MPLTAALVMGGLGAIQGAQKARQNREMMKANAEVMRYSPWTGMNAQLQGPGQDSALGGAAQGALSGAMFGQQMKMNDAASAAAPPSSVDSGTISPAMGSSMTDEMVSQSQAFQPMRSPWSQMGQPKGMYGGSFAKR